MRNVNLSRSRSVASGVLWGPQSRSPAMQPSAINVQDRASPLTLTPSRVPTALDLDSNGEWVFTSVSFSRIEGQSMFHLQAFSNSWARLCLWLWMLCCLLIAIFSMFHTTKPGSLTHSRAILCLVWVVRSIPLACHRIAWYPHCLEPLRSQVEVSTF